MCVNPAEGSIRWPKPWFVSQSAVQGHSVLWGSTELRCTCVCVCVCEFGSISVCVDCALSLLWNAEGNRPSKIKGCCFFCSKCVGISVHIHHCFYTVCVLVSIITSCSSDQRQAPLSVLLIFLLSAFFFFLGSREKLKRTESNRIESWWANKWFFSKAISYNWMQPLWNACLGKTRTWTELY